MVYQMESGKTVSEEAVEKACEKIFESMKTELPEEAQSYDVCFYVLEECKRRLQGKGICL